MKTKEPKLSILLVLILVFVLFTLAVRLADVQEIGPLGSGIGLAGLNSALTPSGINKIPYVISQIIGYAALLTAALFAIDALRQMFSKRTFFGIDEQIFTYNVFSVIILALYVLFDIFPVNYRPVLEDGELAASYPSSHTFLAICVFGMTCIVMEMYGKDAKMTKKVSAVLIVLAAAAVLCRALSGMHWFTDILGAVLLSSAILYGFVFCLKKSKKWLAYFKRE